jgi:hypothetical protein
MSLPCIVKNTGQLFQPLWDSDYRNAGELSLGNSYFGHVYDVREVDRSEEMLEFVFTKLGYAAFTADELTELTVGIRLHPRLRST